MGKGALASPWKCKMLFVLQILSKVSVNKVFMQYFEKMSAYGTPTGALYLDHTGGLPSFRLPYCPPLEKILQAPAGFGLYIS